MIQLGLLYLEKTGQLRKLFGTSPCEYELFHIVNESIDTLANGRRSIYDFNGDDPEKERIIYCADS